MRFYILTSYFLMSLLCVSSVAKSQEELLKALKSGRVEMLEEIFDIVRLDSGNYATPPGPSMYYRDLIPGRYKQLKSICWRNRRQYEINAIAHNGHIVFWRLRMHDPLGVDAFPVGPSLPPIEVDPDQMYELLPVYASIEDMVRNDGKLVDSGCSDSFSQFAKAFYETYGADFNADLYFARMSFGSCGYGGDATSKTVYSILKTADAALLSHWLRSGNLVLQLYALEGYKKRNIMPPGDVYPIIEDILISKEVVEECSGCSSQLTTVRSIAASNQYFELLKK